MSVSWAGVKLTQQHWLNKAKQWSNLYGGAFSLLNLQNVSLPLAIGKVLYRESEVAAAPGGQSSAVP